MANRLLLQSGSLKISRPGVNVLTATLANDFLFNSDYPLPSLLMSGTAVVPSGDQPVTINFPFSAANIPFFSGLIQVGSTWEHIGRAQHNGTNAICQAAVTRSSLQIRQVVPTTSSFNVRYSLWVI